eukprot:5533181-Alexandrium_andersonii.AAC.1
MSASLVGSEMCIRDSLQPGHCTGNSALPHARPASAAHVGPPALPAAMGTCLLYTSDAADDM